MLQPLPQKGASMPCAVQMDHLGKVVPHGGSRRYWTARTGGTNRRLDSVLKCVGVGRKGVM